MARQGKAYLVEVGLEIVHLLGVLEQARPVFFRKVLLLQLDLNVASRVVDLALLGVDVGVEVDLDVVSGLLGIRVASKGKASGLEVEFHVFGWHIGDGDGEPDIVLFSVAGAGALSPLD